MCICSSRAPVVRSISRSVPDTVLICELRRAEESTIGVARLACLLQLKMPSGGVSVNLHVSLQLISTFHVTAFGRLI